MRLISKLESKLGRFAIPGLVQIITILQLMVLCIMMMMPPEAQLNFLGFLELNPDAIKQGEVWRLVTHVFIPRRLSPLWAIFGALLTMMIGSTLEQAWGSFRLNLYVFGWMLVSALGVFLFHWSLPGLYLYQSLLFAFAVLVPDYEIHVYFILPVKVKWLAMLAAAATIFMSMSTPAHLLVALAGHLNFLVAFGPGFISERARMAQVASRRSQFESAKMPQGSFFHQCSVCKKTDLDDPQLDFRVLDSGDEICSVCRAKRTGG